MASNDAHDGETSEVIYYLDWNELMVFTHGQWMTLPDEERQATLERFRLRKEANHKENRWRRLCPPAYRDSEMERIPNRAAFEEVQTWQFGPEGLLAIGETRRGKTRSIWSLLKRLHFGENRSIIALRPMELKIGLADAFQEGTATEWLDRLRNVQVLFLDDLDTVKFTEAVEELIYELFEFRPSHNRPVIVTLNQDGTQLSERMAAYGRGEKIVQRIRESCRVIDFQKC